MNRRGLALYFATVAMAVLAGDAAGPTLAAHLGSQAAVVVRVALVLGVIAFLEIRIVSGSKDKAL